MHKSTNGFVNSVPSGGFTRRRFLQGTVALLAPAAVATKTHSADPPAGPATPHQSREAAEKTMETVAYTQASLPPGIRSRFVNNSNGLTMHMLEAGFEAPGRPCVLLLHGFPELAKGDAAAGFSRLSCGRS